MKEAGIAAACPDFVAAKEAGKMVANMNRMPVMVIDGTPIGQIAVIKRILAKRLGLLGDTDLEGKFSHKTTNLHGNDAALLGQISDVVPPGP